jgi:hypothetical protein
MATIYLAPTPEIAADGNDANFNLPTGQLNIPDAPGVGLEWNEDRRRHRLALGGPHARTGHITPMGPIFSPSANFFCSSLNEA